MRPTSRSLAGQPDCQVCFGKMTNDHKAFLRNLVDTFKDEWDDV